MTKTVAELIIDSLAASGVKRIYGVPGDSINPLVDAIRRRKTIRYVQVRHEEGGAFAASFDAKLSGDISACFGTSGPGAIHLLNGLYDAKMDRASVVAITGQVSSALLGKDSHQEVNLVKLFDDVSVFNRFVPDAKIAPYLIARAIREAKLGHGVAHLNIPVNVLRDKVEESDYCYTEIPQVAYSPSLDSVTDLVAKSQKPILLIGSGTVGRSDLVSTFSEKIGAPIIYALMGKGVIDDNDPRVMGGLGMLGSKSSLEAIKRSDLIIALGTSFPYAGFIPSDKIIIQVDTDPRMPGRVFPVTLPILSDTRTFLESMIQAVPKKDTGFVDDLASARDSWHSSLVEDENRTTNGVNPMELARILSDEAEKDSVVVTDTGNTTVWIARHFMASEGQRFLFSGALASMGNGLPGSIGAALGTDRQVIAAVGDGGFAMTMMELSTVKKYNIPVKILLFNNSKLAMIKYEQEVLGYPEWGVGLYNPDFSIAANAYKINSDRIESHMEIRSKIREMLDHNGPFVLEAITDPNVRPMPPRITIEQATGYLAANIREHVAYDPEIPAMQE